MLALHVRADSRVLAIDNELFNLPGKLKEWMAQGLFLS